jgi:hypothetical protein
MVSLDLVLPASVLDRPRDQAFTPKQTCYTKKGSTEKLGAAFCLPELQKGKLTINEALIAVAWTRSALVVVGQTSR